MIDSRVIRKCTHMEERGRCKWVEGADAAGTTGGGPRSQAELTGI